jgi:hypothetical protein
MEEDDEPDFIEPEEDDDDDYSYQWGPPIGPLPPGTIIG